ncbi:MAG: signal peptidase I [Chloroflexi bacterium]|nr:signal peptidase I [Chloroflexota bacterium]
MMTKPNMSQLALLLQESLQQGHPTNLTVISNSMMPLLQTGDQITLEPVQVSQLETGDIITFAAEKHLFTHRFWALATSQDNTQLYTRGDHMLRFDPPVPAMNLVGRVSRRQRQTSTLDLTYGWGLRLNRHLAWLARLENWGLVGGIGNGRNSQPSLFKRLMHRGIYMWAWLFTKMIDR